MSGENFNKPANHLRILIAPLDWGIGHTTRCIPIIYALIKAGSTVLLAGDTNSEIILKKEFPSLLFLPLKGYEVHYSRHKRWFLTKLLVQIPAIKRTIHYEQQWLLKVVKEQHIDRIISDNRFGLYHQSIPCIYITHQLFIETGCTWLNNLAQKIHYSYINRFTECWIPDAEGQVNLGGSLSHPRKLPAVPVRYLGVLSRFSKTDLVRTNPLLVVLSGPEPQRSIFETIILAQLKRFSGQAILVRGLPAETTEMTVGSHVSIRNYVPAKGLNQLIQESQFVLSRAGYSTIMDLAVLQQKAILVPTPGQKEQEYLADSLKDSQVFYSCPQKKFNLNIALAEAADFYKGDNLLVQRFDEKFIEHWLGNTPSTNYQQ